MVRNLLFYYNPLVWLNKIKEPNSRLIRWRLKLEEFDFTIVYKKGQENFVADALSRIEVNFGETESVLPQVRNASANLKDFEGLYQEEIETEEQQNIEDENSSICSLHSNKKPEGTGNYCLFLNFLSIVLHAEL